jgi:hypothetical protein
MCLRTYADVGFDDYRVSEQLQNGKRPYKEKVDRSAFANANMACENYFVTETARLIRQARRGSLAETRTRLRERPVVPLPRRSAYLIG